jgi:AcrR family transcriptional regulator
MDAAMELFAHRGYEQTSVQMIARAAGVSHGLLYHYFASKHELLHALFARSVADVRQALALSIEADDPGERIALLVRHSFAILKQNRQFWRLSYSVRVQPAVMEGLGPELQEWMLSLQQSLEQLFVDAGAPNPTVKAAVLFALIDGVSQQYVQRPEEYPLDAVAEEMIAAFSPDREHRKEADDA